MRVISPVIKWAGGKSQLLNQILNRLPENKNTITTYIEPFIGGASVFLNLITEFPNLNTIVINDLNTSLYNIYTVIKNNPEQLITMLDSYYNDFKNSINKTKSYINYRTLYNELKSNNNSNEYNIQIAALFILLNKLCFNGLYRENKKGEFNVPYNKSIPVSIYDKDNIIEFSKLLNEYNVIITNESYETVITKYIRENSFVYLDPPYRPINKQSFTAYLKSGFNDNNQKELKTYCDIINDNKSYFMLSNSDPHNTDINDNFFDELYSDYKLDIVFAFRSINSKGDKRGKISELIITNY